MDTIGFFTSEEKKLFFSKYRLLLRNLYSFLEREDIRKMKELMKRVVALDCYGRDKNGINGLLRNIDTALIATLEIGLKRTSVIALLLYRPVLKKAITIEEVEQKFGADVTLIIRRLLKTSDLYARNTAVNSENFHHLLFSFAEDVRVILLMIADRLCLMRMGKQMQEDDRIRLATEASYLYAPLAHRLGLYTIKSELEDLSLKYTDRKQYDFIKRKLNETKRSRDAYIAEFIAPIKRKLAAAGFKFDIKGRTKSIHSINNKLKKLEDRLEQRKSDQKEILLERIRDKEHAEIYTEMLKTCEEDIQQITEEIESIKYYNTTIKKRKSELKKTVDMIEEIIKDGAISDANLRLLVDEIKIYESDKKLRIENLAREQERKEPAFCSNCGELLDEGTLFCGNCGVKQD